MLSRKTSRFLIRSWIEAIASSASVGGLVASWARDNGVAKKQQVAMTRAACANVFATVARTVLGADGLWILNVVASWIGELWFFNLNPRGYPGVGVAIHQGWSTAFARS